MTVLASDTAETSEKDAPVLRFRIEAVHQVKNWRQSPITRYCGTVCAQIMSVKAPTGFPAW